MIELNSCSLYFPLSFEVCYSCFLSYPFKGGKRGGVCILSIVVSRLFLEYGTLNFIFLQFI